MVNDVRLREVRDAFSVLAAEHLNPFLRSLKQQELPRGSVQAVESKRLCSWCSCWRRPVRLSKKLGTVHKPLLMVETITRQLLLLQRRSEDVLSEFAEFYCVRLLLDKQSPLATYFIDLFSQLEWLLERLRAAFLKGPPGPETQLAAHDAVIHIRFPDESILLPLLLLVRPVAATCRLLYVAYMILPTSTEGQLRVQAQRKFWKDEVKIQGRQYREFSKNPAHCLMRELGFTNLDQPGQSMIKLSEKLGQGNFAAVYKGVFELLADGAGTSSTSTKRIVGDPVAVKMFPADMFPSAEHSFDNLLSQQRPLDQQLSLELYRLVSAKHPNIVTPKGYIGKRAEGDCGLVMELMDGSLDEYLKEVKTGKVPPLQEQDMLGLMLEIARGMRFLHECSFIHRDLKPQNVLLRFLRDRDGETGYEYKLVSEVKLADFGLTKFIHDHFYVDEAGESSTGRVSMHTMMAGTHCYMAPEMRGSSTSTKTLAHPEKVDVFSFGSTCFNILTGNPDALDFSGVSRHDFYEAVSTGNWKEWMQGKNAPALSKHLHYLVKLIDRCWERDPTKRPTFATVCLLLQHAMQLNHVVSCAQTPMYNTVGTTSAATQSIELLITCSLEYAGVYSSIILSYLQEQEKSVILGLQVVTECLLGFKSVVALAHNTLARELFCSLRERSIVAFGKALCKKIKQQHLIQELEAAAAATGHYTIGRSRSSSHLYTSYYYVHSISELAKLALSRGLISNVGLIDVEKFLNSNIGLTDASATPTILRSSYEIMDSFLDEPDPLIFMKRLPCHILVERYCPKLYADKFNSFTSSCNQYFDELSRCTFDVRISEVRARFTEFFDEFFDELKWERTPFDLPPSYEDQKLWFDFKSDEAYSELSVDTSLIPLLVAFWATELDPVNNV